MKLVVDEVENNSERSSSAGPIRVAIGVLVERKEGRTMVLIARRPKNGVLGGYWEFPGGKVEPGEQLEQCLVREFEEELGLQVSVIGRLPVVEHRYGHGWVRLVPFFCCRKAGQPRPLQVTEHKWVEPRELAAYQFPPANRPLLSHIVQNLSRSS